MENNMEVPQKIKNKITIWSSNPNLGMCSKEMKSVSQRNTWTPTFIATLFTITMVWNQSTCLVMDEWIKIWHCYAQTYNGHYSAWFKRGNLSFVAKWMDPEDIRLSEISQAQNDKYEVQYFHMNFT
jgi:hypothetical protein